MSYPYSDFPGLLPLGVHDVTIEQLRSRCVTNFPVSVNRPRIFEGFLKIVRRLLDQEVAGNLVVDGRFLTEEIEPKDIDFALCVSPELYATDNGCGGSHSDIKFLEHSVVDECDADVFVASALTGRGIELPQQVQLGSAGGLKRLVGWCFGEQLRARGRQFFGLGSGPTPLAGDAPCDPSGCGAFAGGFGKTCGLAPGCFRLTRLQGPARK